MLEDEGMELISAIKRGDKRAAARLISMLENNDPEGIKLLQSGTSTSSKASVIGITGAPGAGKSTLTDQLVKFLLKSGKKIGVIAVDPSSPISGGAFLGDRIRMSDLNSQPNVFIRSMATRGALGGISKAVSGAVRVMEIYGAEYIFIETVGIGQSEIDVARQADTVVLVVVPGMGDDIQAEKAGVLEVSDIIAVNKADHEDTDRTIKQLKSMLGLRMKLRPEMPGDGGAETEIVSTIAMEGEGIPQLMAAIENHLASSGNSGNPSDQRRIVQEIDLKALLAAKLESELADFDKETNAIGQSAEKIAAHKTEVDSEIHTLLDAYIKWRTQKC
jgi:LAO/AO transport system kinase